MLGRGWVEMLRLDQDLQSCSLEFSIHASLKLVVDLAMLLVLESMKRVFFVSWIVQSVVVVVVVVIHLAESPNHFEVDGGVIFFCKGGGKLG